MLLRSKINQSIDEAINFFNHNNIHLPDYAHFSPHRWQQVGPEYDEIKQCHLGWDVTDFGTGDFTHFGRTIFTTRNGLANSKQYSKPYSQKIMHLVEGKKSTIHFHKNKHEDIINHTGGQIAIKVWHSTNQNELSKESIVIFISGVKRSVKAGKILLLKPGESIYLIPYTFHQFWAQKGGGDVVSMEVSSVNDDYTDNYWLKSSERFPQIKEDEPTKYVLCNEY